MSRAGGVMDGVAVAVEMPKPRSLGRRVQDSGAAIPVFSEQLDVLAAATIIAEAGADPATAEPRKSAAAGQDRQHAHQVVDLVEPRARPMLATREIPFPLEESEANETRAGATHPAAVRDSTMVRPGSKPLENAGVASPPIGGNTVIAMGAAERALQVSSEKAGHSLDTGVRSMPDAGATFGQAGTPDRDAAGRADVGSSGAHQPAPAISAPARASPIPTPATARAVASAAAGRQSARAGDVLVKVVRHETHPPLAERLSPALQIANAVAAGLQRSDDLGPVRAPTSAPSQPSISARPVQVLQIRLEPPELGTVSVRMRLDANALEVRIDARQPGTADLIRSDQGALTRLLQSAGYDVEILTIHVAEPHRSAASSISSAHQSPQSTPHQSAFQAHSGNAQPDGRSGWAHQHANQQNQAARIDAATSGSEAPGAGAPGSGGIYV